MTTLNDRAKLFTERLISGVMLGLGIVGTTLAAIAIVLFLYVLCGLSLKPQPVTQVLANGDDIVIETTFYCNWGDTRGYNNATYNEELDRWDVTSWSSGIRCGLYSGEMVNKYITSWDDAYDYSEWGVDDDG